MNNRKKIAIYGAGGFGREVAWLVSSLAGAGTYEHVAYIDDGARDDRSLGGRPVVPWDHFTRMHSDALIGLAVGDPQVRRRLARRCSEAGYAFATLVHASVEMSPSVDLAAGSIVCCGTILTVDITVEQQVHINLGCTVGHDVRIGEFTTVSPGVHVSGNVHIGPSVFIGTGANIINGTTADPLVIAEGTVIAAGACITKSTEPNCLYTGVPAVLKKRYA